MSGSLAVVGTGIRALTQLTAEANAVIRGSDVVHYVVPDGLSAQMLHWQSKEARDLADLYDTDRDRTDTYQAMVERIVADVAEGRDVCAVFYGHPGVFVDPSHEAIRRVQAMGLPARMLPGVSAADALYADLEFDPGTDGIAQYTAMDFLLRPRTIDPTTPLLLWQIGAVGEPKGALEPARQYLNLVVEALQRHYPDDHPVVLYVASTQPTGDAIIEVVPLAQLPHANVTRETTMLVPPAGRATTDAAMAAQLGVNVSADDVRPGRLDTQQFRAGPALESGQFEELSVSGAKPGR